MRNFLLVSMLTFFAVSCDNSSAKTTNTTQWCGEAYEDLEKLMTALKDTVPKGEAHGIKIPKRLFYLQQCHRLPLNAQRCLAVSFAQQNTKICQSLTLKGDDKLNFEKLMAGQ